ncbi:MAG: RusA family crossover junction endodeoxyribonuclease [Solirubrobacterales bacterium]
MEPNEQYLAGIEFVLDGDELLRKKWPGLAAAQKAFREVAAEQMRMSGQSPFDGSVEIAVQLDFHAPDRNNQPHIRGVVKAYLDALEGVAYERDRQVSCLVVHRRATDHPMLAGAPENRAGQQRAFFYAAVLPVVRYTELYDRAYQSIWRDRQRSPWWPEWWLREETKLRGLRHELKASGVEPNPHLVELVRSMEEQRLRSGFLADIDRPGPLPSVINALHRILPLPRLHQYLRKRHGAVMLLPLRGQGRGTNKEWKAAVGQILRDFRREHSGLPFKGFVALDVAVRGTSRDGKDLDNLVHGFLGPFEEELCAGRGTVVSYRVYEAVGEPRGVQVRVLDDGRLLMLENRLARLRTRYIGRPA